MMNRQLDWTQKLGDAMIGQQKDVADSIQRLRAKAAAAGNLKSDAAAEGDDSSRPRRRRSSHRIEPANPEVDLRAVLQPELGLRRWPYPAYPPAYYPPPPRLRRGAGDRLDVRPGLRRGGRDVRRLELGLGRLGRGNSYTRQRQPRDQHQRQQFQRATTIATATGSTIPRIATACPIATRPSRERYDQHRARCRPAAQAVPRPARPRRRAASAARGNRGAEGAATRTGNERAQRRPRRRAAGATDARQRWRGSETTAAHRSAFDGVNRGQEVNREADRGHSYARRCAARSSERRWTRRRRGWRTGGRR